MSFTKAALGSDIDEAGISDLRVFTVANRSSAQSAPVQPSAVRGADAKKSYGGRIVAIIVLVLGAIIGSQFIGVPGKDAQTSSPAAEPSTATAAQVKNVISAATKPASSGAPVRANEPKKTRRAASHIAPPHSEGVSDSDEPPSHAPTPDLDTLRGIAGKM